MGNRVARVKTVVSEPQMASAIADGWKQLFNDTPSKQQIALVLAQNALETGNRQKMWNFNLGNITTSGKASYDFYDDLETSEQMKPGVWEKKYLKYRAYPSLTEGVKDYLKFISTHYPDAWNNILHTDPIAFSKSLKKGGYYTANEAPYTKLLSKLYNKFTKTPDTTVVNNQNMKPSNDVSSMLDNYLQQVAASEKQYKKIYKKFLPTHDILIKVNSSSINNSIEFSRILCTALDEKLLGNAFTYTDGKNVEINCSISGPSKECFAAVQQLTNSIADAFYEATNKIGGIIIKPSFVINKKSSYNKIDCKVAIEHYTKFMQKFA